MYFDSYEESLKAALIQSRRQLADCNLYIKYDSNEDGGWKIGFTPDNAEDGYVYNGKFFNTVKED